MVSVVPMISVVVYGYDAYGVYDTYEHNEIVYEMVMCTRKPKLHVSVQPPHNVGRA